MYYTILIGYYNNIDHMRISGVELPSVVQELEEPCEGIMLIFWY